MPYADPEKAKEAKRKYYNKRRALDESFRESEKLRAAQWIEENRERHNANVQASRMRKMLGFA